MSFFKSILGFEPSPKPGDLLSMAREVSDLWARFERSSDGVNSPERLAEAGAIFERRMDLAQSWPANDLDMLVLIFNARQAVRLLRIIDLTVLDEPRRKYWTEEIEHGLIGVQRLLEQRTGTTMNEMGFSLDDGTAVN